MAEANNDLLELEQAWNNLFDALEVIGRAAKHRHFWTIRFTGAGIKQGSIKHLVNRATKKMNHIWRTTYNAN